MRFNVQVTKLAILWACMIAAKLIRYYSSLFLKILLDFQSIMRESIFDGKTESTKTMHCTISYKLQAPRII